MDSRSGQPSAEQIMNLCGNALGLRSLRGPSGPGVHGMHFLCGPRWHSSIAVLRRAHPAETTARIAAGDDRAERSS